MDTFVKFRDKLVDHFNDLTRDADYLYTVNVDKDKMWDLYLDSFPPGTNEIYRERREHDCSCCRHFIKQIGNVVVIKDCKVYTIWEFDTESTTYQPVVDALDKYIKSHAVTDVWFTKEKQIGCKENHENMKGIIHTWSHLYIPEIPRKFRFSDSLGNIQNTFRTRKQVFQRSLNEISVEATDTVLEIIKQNNLYRGDEWKYALEEFLKYQKDYVKIPEENRDLWAWEKSVSVGEVIGRIRNHSIGTLLVDISNGVDIEEAVRKYEAIVAPSNYKRPKAIFTKKMLEEAKKTITELGYLDSLGRRFATLDDITINDILFTNRDSARRITGALDIFDEMEKDISINPKKFERVDEITIEDFLSDVLPRTKELSVMMENKHSGNLVSLIAPQVKTANPMFKWNNNFSWAYNGNVTDSMKERVKAAGGKVDGDLRFSIQWNDIPGDYDRNDLDAHCEEPRGGDHIYYSHKRSIKTHGALDVDITHPEEEIPAVENITWESRKTMIDGEYLFYVNQYAYRGGNKGFRAEIEFDGQIFSFDYPTKVRDNVEVAIVTLKNGEFTIKPLLNADSKISSREIWGVHTNQFTPVSVVMFSPNYWEEVENKTGNKHYFFMLKGCTNENNPNGFFNEYLKPELTQHKRVFEALGSKAKVADCDDQLSGLGFSSTQRNELIAKIKGDNWEKVVKIKF